MTTQDTWGVLSADLRQHALAGSVRASETTRFGQKFEVVGLLRGPKGEKPKSWLFGLSLSKKISRGS